MRMAFEHLCGGLLRGGANDRKRGQVVGDVGDPFRIDLLGFPERSAHLDDGGLVLFGLYLGQRLGDLARLTWRAIDTKTGEIAFTTRKTGRRIVLPLVQPLIDYLSALPASDNPNAYIFPNAATHKRTASLSNQFREILSDAGLVEPRGHEAVKQGRSQARETSEISFHSLRHSAVTMLKAAGVSDFIAREIVGHESAAVSRQYTHLTTDDKRAAMRRLPDVTGG